MNTVRVRQAALRGVIVLVPSYTAACISGEMVWVVPTLAASAYFAATVGSEPSTTQRVDEDGDDGEQHGGDEDDEGDE